MEAAGTEALEKILGKSTNDFVKRAYDRGPTTEFSDKFNKGFGLFLGRECWDIAARSNPTIVQHEGPFGIMPPPAKRQIAKEVLAGLPTSPLKILEETVEGAPEKVIDQLAFHVIAEINPLTAANSEEISAVVNVLQVLQQRLHKIQEGKDIWTYENNSRPPIRIQKGKGFLHLIQRSVLGNYSFNSLSLDYPADVQKAIDIYREGLQNVYKFSPEDTPKDDVVAHTVLFSRIKKEIEGDRGEGRLSLPIVTYPKTYGGTFDRGWKTYAALVSLSEAKPFLLKDENRLVLAERRYINQKDGWQIVNVKDDTVVILD